LAQFTTVLDSEFRGPAIEIADQLLHAFGQKDIFPALDTGLQQEMRKDHVFAGDLGELPDLRKDRLTVGVRLLSS
jgi:hypothetical protein